MCQTMIWRTARASGASRLDDGPCDTGGPDDRLRSEAVQGHHPRSSGRTPPSPWHRWGPTLEAWLGEATERMLDAARRRPGQPRARRRRRRRRPDARSPPDASAPAAGSSPPTSPRRSSPTRRRQPPKPGSATSRRSRPTARRWTSSTAGSFDAVVSRVGPDLLPRPAAGARRNAPGAARRRPHRGHRVLHARAQRVLLRSRCRSSAAGPSCPRHSPASPDRSASAAPACSRQP